MTSLVAVRRESGSQNGFGGKLGGLAGADEICRKIAEQSMPGSGAKGWRAERFPREGSGLLSSLATTDGFAILAEETTAVAPGDALRFLPYSEVAA